MYHIAEILGNDRAPSHIAEISFHPSGSYFAVTYEHLNEVRIFDSQTRKLLQLLGNPESQLSNPHGVLFTEKYLLVSNANDLSKPGTINVYRNDGTITKPIQIFQSPFSHLREPHSLALRGGRLVATYAENVAPSGAVVCYGFNEETGTITGPLDKTESWFSEYGDPKGICFNADGTKILVTFKSYKQYSVVGKIFRSFALDGHLPVQTRLMNLSNKAIRKVKNKILQSSRAFNDARRISLSERSVEIEKPNPQYVTPTKNGLATFSISTEGKIARRPEQVIERKDFCRLENIDIFGGTCAVTDTVNHLLLLFDLTQDQNFTNPFHIVNLGNATPHGAKFSPDGSLLVISSLGRKIVNQEIIFRNIWESPREDKIFVLERTGATVKFR
jgi:DNA-binding beta-propeller fold protein YncE